jgi:uncharacterized membrane protein SpoIIM required for sporulation
MVFEEIYPKQLLERHVLFAFILGIAISAIGIGFAVVIFPEDPALVGVAFTSIMLVPTINSIIGDQLKVESSKYRFLSFLSVHWRILLIYALLFLGVFFSFAFFSLFLPNIAVNHLFETQVAVRYGNVGGAILNDALFPTILSNNLLVMIIIFLTALLIGDGGLFLLVWNASVWGTLFAILAKTASAVSGKDPMIYFILVLVSVFPHMMIEALGYFTAAASGGIISKAFVKEKGVDQDFRLVLVHSLFLLIFAVIIVFIGAYVETYVLQHADVYRTIITQSFSFVQ